MPSPYPGQSVIRTIWVWVQCSEVAVPGPGHPGPARSPDKETATLPGTGPGDRERQWNPSSEQNERPCADSGLGRVSGSVTVRSEKKKREEKQPERLPRSNWTQGNLPLAPASQVIISSQEHNGPIVPLVAGVGVQERGEVRREGKGRRAWPLKSFQAGLGTWPEKQAFSGLCLLTCGGTAAVANPRLGPHGAPAGRTAVLGGRRPEHTRGLTCGHASLAGSSAVA